MGARGERRAQWPLVVQGRRAYVEFERLRVRHQRARVAGRDQVDHPRCDLRGLHLAHNFSGPPAAPPPSVDRRHIDRPTSTTQDERGWPALFECVPRQGRAADPRISPLLAPVPRRLASEASLLFFPTHLCTPRSRPFPALFVPHHSGPVFVPPRPRGMVPPVICTPSRRPRAVGSGSESMTRLTRVEERETLHNLNSRLQIFLSRVKELESRNSELQAKVDTGSAAAKSHNDAMRAVYERELAELRAAQVSAQRSPYALCSRPPPARAGAPPRRSALACSIVLVALPVLRRLYAGADACARLPRPSEAQPCTVNTQFAFDSRCSLLPPFLLRPPAPCPPRIATLGLAARRSKTSSSSPSSRRARRPTRRRRRSPRRWRRRTRRKPTGATRRKGGCAW